MESPIRVLPIALTFRIACVVSAGNATCRVATLACLTLLAGCSGSNNGIAQNQPQASIPFQELYDQGIDRYLDKYSPMLTESEGDVVVHTFGTGDGPLCIYGEPYRMATRDTGSSELMIYLQGGGRCASDSCEVIFPAGWRGIRERGILDTTRQGNPVASWSTAFVPYCDGGFHVSDADVDSDGDGKPDRFQRGLHNLSAALDVAAATFPSPGRILLAASSAGAYGSQFALALVRKLYPEVPIEFVNDSGVGLLKQDNPAFVRTLLNEWNANAFIPASCTTCIGADGHLTDYYKWALEQDSNFRLGMMSFKQDRYIHTSWFSSVESFEQTLHAELSELENVYPARVHSFLATGTDHAILVDGLDSNNALDATAGGVTAMDWLTSMLQGSAEWVSYSD